MLYALIIGDLLMAIVFGLNMNHMPPQIPLYNSRGTGGEQLAETWYIFLIPVMLHIMIFFNIYFYNRFFLPDQFIKKLINIANWFIIVVFTLMFIKIIFFIT
jgi:hypothetical protein